jgi:hypothetical protein
VTSTYYLLLKRKLRNGDNSIADFNLKSQLFIDYITSASSDLKQNLEEVISKYIYNFKIRHNLLSEFELQNEEMEKKPTFNNLNNFIEPFSLKPRDGNLLDKNVDRNASNTSRKNSATNLNKSPPATVKKQWGKYKDIYVYKKSLKDTPQDKVKNRNESSNKKLSHAKETSNKKILEFSTFEEKNEERLETVTEPYLQVQSLTAKKIESKDFTPEKKLYEETLQTETSVYDQILQTEPTKKNKNYKKKQIEVPFALDLKSGVMRNFLQSSKRNSIREEYDKYVKKSSGLALNNDILLTNVSKREVLITENLQTISSYNNVDKIKIENFAPTTKIKSPSKNDSAVLDSHMHHYSNYNKEKHDVSTKNNSQNHIPYKKEIESKRFLNTSIISGKEENKSKNNSFDESKTNQNKNLPEPKKKSLTSLKKAIVENFSNNSKPRINKNDISFDKIFNYKSIKNLTNENKTLPPKNNKNPIDPFDQNKILKTEVIPLITYTHSNNRLQTENNSPTIKKMKLDILSFNKNNYLNNYPVQTTSGNYKETNQNYNHIKGMALSNNIVPLRTLNKTHWNNINTPETKKTSRPYTKSPIDKKETVNFPFYNQNMWPQNSKRVVSTSANKNSPIESLAGICTKKSIKSIKEILESICGKGEVFVFVHGKVKNIKFLEH